MDTKKTECRCARCGRPLAAKEGDPCDICRDEGRPRDQRALMLAYLDLTIGVGGILAVVLA